MRLVKTINSIRSDSRRSNSPVFVAGSFLVQLKKNAKQNAEQEAAIELDDSAANSKR